LRRCSPAISASDRLGDDPGEVLPVPLSPFLSQLLEATRSRRQYDQWIVGRWQLFPEVHSASRIDFVPSASRALRSASRCCSTLLPMDLEQKLERLGADVRAAQHQHAAMRRPAEDIGACR
jgi:hypothetical protein